MSITGPIELYMIFLFVDSQNASLHIPGHCYGGIITVSPHGRDPLKKRRITNRQKRPMIRPGGNKYLSAWKMLLWRLEQP
jgi:hypothetical protein